jgi:hypothetical protein
MYERIPERIRQALDRYHNDGILPGGFLRAVLTNDLFGVIRHADPDSYAALREIASYVYNELPSKCHGSEKKMLAWSDEKRAERLASQKQ